MNATDLPGVLREIAEIVGVDATLTLARARGGTEVYIPAQSRPGHWLVKAVGEQAARRICREYAGATLMLPLGPTGTMAQARHVADRMIREGHSSAAIASTVGLTTRAIERRRQRRRDRRDPRQTELS